MNVFVILHYQNLEVTCQAIDLLLELAGDEKKIVVVDNGSPNNSGIDLEKMYKDIGDVVHVILLPNNIGFASGNNYGYKYAKDNFAPKCIIVMNNDILIENRDWLNVLEENIQVYEQKYEILLPRIINLLGVDQNPFRLTKVSRKKINYIYIYNVLLSFFLLIPGLSDLICKRIIQRNQRKEINNTENLNIIEDAVPHGSCMIYLEKWIKNEDIAFVEGTFMYFEEDILFSYIKKKNYRTIYTPIVEVKHMEDASTNYSSKSFKDKKKFISKNMIKSIRLLKKMERMS